MSNTVKRLLTFFIGFPLVAVISLAKPFNHIGLQILIFAVSTISIFEYHNLISSKIENFYPKWLFCSLGMLEPVLASLFLYLGLSHEILLWVYTFTVIILMAIECLSAQDFTKSAEKIALGAFGIFYIDFLISFVNRLPVFGNQTHVIVLFMTYVFMCDSSAWFFGILFGKNNRGIFKASPNKSIAGFIGGIFSDVAIAAIVKLIFPNILTADIWRYMVIAFFTALAAIIGDLIESVIKRSCGAKDSGKVIPGRGGMLDCIDSIVVAAPVFYILYSYLIAIPA